MGGRCVLSAMLQKDVEWRIVDSGGKEGADEGRKVAKGLDDTGESEWRWGEDLRVIRRWARGGAWGGGGRGKNVTGRAKIEVAFIGREDEGTYEQRWE